MVARNYECPATRAVPCVLFQGPRMEIHNGFSFLFVAGMTHREELWNGKQASERVGLRSYTLCIFLSLR